MATFEYFNAPGNGANLSANFAYSQSVKLPNGTVKLSGQGGWDPETGALDANDEKGQIELAFVNIEKHLKGFDLTFDDVYALRTYHVDITESVGPLVEVIKKTFRTHKPILTAVAVPRLALPGMRIEIEVEALKA